MKSECVGLTRKLVDRENPLLTLRRVRAKCARGMALLRALGWSASNPNPKFA